MGKRLTGPRNPPGVTRRLVKELYDQGMDQQGIAAALSIAKSTVAYHVRRFGIPSDDRFGRRYDWAEIRRVYDSGVSMRECRKRFGFSSDAWRDAIGRGDVVARPREMPIEELLVVGRRTNRTHLKARLLKAGLKDNRCEVCGIAEWLGRPLNMQLHHVNGDGVDNRLENIQFLCGNCHSQTANYGGRGLVRQKRGHLRLVEGTSNEPEVGEQVG